MAGSLWTFSSKVVPAVQVIPIMRKHILLLHKGFCESQFAFGDRFRKSAFLSDFFCKRNIGSFQSVKAVEEKLATCLYATYPLTKNELLNDNFLENNLDDSECHSLMKKSENGCKLPQKYGVKFPVNNLAKEIYLYNGQLHSLSFCTPSDEMFSEYEKRMIVLSEASKDPAPEPQENASGRPSAQQLEHVLNVLSQSLPRLFVQPLDYTIYHPQIIFENNIRGTRTVGLFHYVKQIALVRLIGHVKFAYVSFDILKITSHPEDGTVKVRWRIRGISGLKVFFNFWKINILKLRDTIDRESESWYDGFSTFFVDAEGKVYKHVVDKMQPDPENKAEEVKPLTPLAAKLALMLGLVPRDNLDLSTLLSIIQEHYRCLYDAMLPLDKIV